MGLLNVHKKLIGKPHLAEVGNEFVSLNQERFQYFSNLLYTLNTVVTDWA